MKDAAADVRPFDDPAPPGVPLDMITFLFFYHDTTYMGVDRSAMNKAMFAALEPGGTLVSPILPRCRAKAPVSARRCTASKRAPSARRSKRPASSSSAKAISGAIVRTHDYPSYKKDVPIDNFVLKFQKPN